MREPDFIAQLVLLTIALINPEIPGLTDAELVELRAAEEAREGGPRKGVIEAIELDQMHRQDLAAEQAAAGISNSAEEGAAAPVAWQEPAYCGPLHAEQAAWRNANLKS